MAVLPFPLLCLNTLMLSFALALGPALRLCLTALGFAGNLRGVFEGVERGTGRTQSWFSWGLAVNIDGISERNPLLWPPVGGC